MIVEVECRWCGKVKNIRNVDLDGFRKWRDGANIQDVLPDVKPEDRELMISQTCPECWKKMFPAEEVRDCDTCIHYKEFGCEVWDCGYEHKESEEEE